MTGLAHAHDRGRPRQQPVQEAGIGPLGFRIQHGVGRLGERFDQLRSRRHALQHVTLQRREVERPADFFRARQLVGIALAAIDGTLEVGKLQRQHDTRGIGVAVGLAGEDGLQLPLQRGEPAGERAKVGGLGGAPQPLLDFALEAVETLG